MLYRNLKKGQSTMEYLVLVTIVLAALLAMGTYFKRALQGRWKAIVDDFGEQYDPRLADSDMTFRLYANTETRVTTFNTTLNDKEGIWTLREDASNSIETRTGDIEIGSY